MRCMHKAVSFRLDPDLVAAVKAEAERRGISVTALVKERLEAVTPQRDSLLGVALPSGADLAQYPMPVRPPESLTPPPPAEEWGPT